MPMVAKANFLVTKLHCCKMFWSMSCVVRWFPHFVGAWEDEHATLKKQTVALGYFDIARNMLLLLLVY